MIILDSHQAAVDLLDKKGAIYNDRPKLTLYELKIKDFERMQTEEARTLVRNLMESPPEKYGKFMSRFATGIITQIVAGHQITRDPREAARSTSSLSVRELYEYPLRAKHGEASPSFVLEHLERMEEGDDEDDLKGAAATMFGAGEATTWSALTIFILAMILHPEMQVKAQQEIDSVVGDLRLPEFKDRVDLSFIEGILQENFRWNPPVPLGIPYRAMENDVYNGMFIPKGALIFANIKGMALDENVYSNPLSFRPERCLAKPTGAGEPPFNQVFGVGRRICTGQYVADNSLWIAVATILATCTITNAVDESGEIIVPGSTLTDGLVRQVTMRSA
ncbi:cytochrome P450 [Mycena albidolilacea]|uniref:Cytochrome P450 n=1 Tax=Mycena albidolilacea TaxID=1033008 RepID=A0AAD7EY46_9AGAR|nr:cytochrome P450 [Mycena albidolilacea]